MTMEHGSLFSIVIFQLFLLFLCRDAGDKEIVPYLLLKGFRPYFLSSSRFVLFELTV